MDPTDPRLAVLLEERARTGRASGELTFIRGDGSRFEAELSSTIFDSPAGSRAGIVFRDITERKRAEAQLRLQSSALEAAANAIVITNHKGVIEWANPAFSVFTGYTSAEAIGRTPGELLKSGRHDAAFYRDLWNTILSGHVWKGEIVNRRKDGSCYTEELVITPLRSGARNEITHFIAVKQDIGAPLSTFICRSQPGRTSPGATPPPARSQRGEGDNSTGYSTDVAGQDLVLEAGFNFLPKPFDLTKLAEILRHRLDH